jgi:hypothetical protein
MGQIDHLRLVPEPLKEAIAKAEAIVEADRLHHLDWHYRREMYKTFGTSSNRVVWLVRGWLAVLSAQFVLPIFEQRPFASLISDDPDDFEGLPRRVITEAINLLQGSADQQIVDSVEDDAYMTFGTWDIESDHSFSLKASTAGFTSYKAIIEVMGKLEPFAHAEAHSKATRPMRPYEDVSNIAWIHGDQFTDSDWARLAACGDAAGCAAIAYSCDRDSLEQCDPERLNVFWRWWLLEAIPKAWEIVLQG